MTEDQELDVFSIVFVIVIIYILLGPAGWFITQLLDKL